MCIPWCHWNKNDLLTYAADAMLLVMCWCCWCADAMMLPRIFTEQGCPALFYHSSFVPAAGTAGLLFLEVKQNLTSGDSWWVAVVLKYLFHFDLGVWLLLYTGCFCIILVSDWPNILKVKDKPQDGTSIFIENLLVRKSHQKNLDCMTWVEFLFELEGLPTHLHSCSLHSLLWATGGKVADYIQTKEPIWL